MTFAQGFIIALIVVAWTMLGFKMLETMPTETPRGMKAIFYCIGAGPLLGTIMAGIILWEMAFGDEKQTRKKAERREYEGDMILHKIYTAMDHPTNQYEVNGEWLHRDEAIKKIISNYFNKA